MENKDSARWPDSLLDQLRLVGDPLADAALLELAQTAGPDSSARPDMGGDLVAAVSRRAAATAGACSELIGQAYAVPAWVSFPRMLAGYRIGLSHPVAGGLALLCGSLAESYSAALAAKVLVRSGDLQRSTRRRIYETADFLYVLASSGGPRPGTHAHRVLLNLRLMHARVRRMVQRRSDWDPRWGVPVNQEDNGSTLVMFSLVYARSLQRLGVALTPAERDSIHHAWRYGGYVLGIDERLLTESCAAEEALYAVLSRRQHRPDADSHALLTALFAEMAWQPPLFLPMGVLYAVCRVLLGERLADAMGVPRAPLWRAAPALWRALGQAQQAVRERLPGADEIGQRLGTRIIQSTLQYGLAKSRGQSRAPVKPAPAAGRGAV